MKFGCVFVYGKPNSTPQNTTAAVRAKPEPISDDYTGLLMVRFLVIDDRNRVTFHDAIGTRGRVLR